MTNMQLRLLRVVAMILFFDAVNIDTQDAYFRMYFRILAL